MANSDWVRESPKKQEQKWFYFQPVLNQIIEPGWQISVRGNYWLEPVFPELPIQEGDLEMFWRKPYTPKGNN